MCTSDLITHRGARRAFFIATDTRARARASSSSSSSSSSSVMADRFAAFAPQLIRDNASRRVGDVVKCVHLTSDAGMALNGAVGRVVGVGSLDDATVAAEGGVPFRVKVEFDGIPGIKSIRTVNLVHPNHRPGPGRDDSVRTSGAFYITLVPIRPRTRGERRSLRTLLPGVSLRPGSLAFNPRPRRLSTPTDAFELHPDVRFVRNDPQPSPSRARTSRPRTPSARSSPGRRSRCRTRRRRCIFR